jgi:hypothetical protein
MKTLTFPVLAFTYKLHKTCTSFTYTVQIPKCVFIFHKYFIPIDKVNFQMCTHLSPKHFDLQNVYTPFTYVSQFTKCIFRICVTDHHTQISICYICIYTCEITCDVTCKGTRLIYYYVTAN